MSTFVVNKRNITDHSFMSLTGLLQLMYHVGPEHWLIGVDICPQTYLPGCA